MRRPTKRAILFFVLALGTGYTISLAIMFLLLDAPLRLYGFLNLSLVAFLIAGLLLVWLDKPFNLKLFEWPAEKPEAKQKTIFKPEPETGEVTAIESIEVSRGAFFPHEIPSEHWNPDFGDSKQVYQGTELPIWLLAGWAAFIIWAVIYLVTGLPTAFQ